MKQSKRQAVTLVEVIFAIGVILIGLLGLLSILPLAGKRAQDSISLSVAPEFAGSIFSELRARKFWSNNRLFAIRPGFRDSTEPEPSFCIDPLFLSDPLVDTQNPVVIGGYDNSIFPHYGASHDPLTDPSSSDPTLNFQAPRLFRVGLRNTDGTLLLTNTEARRLVERADDLIITRPEDRSLPAKFSDGQIAPLQGGLEYGRRIPSGQFSWLATVNPFPDGVYASVSVVVLRDRTLELDFEFPNYPNAAASPENNKTGERLAYVSYAQGFRGGAGGVVHLKANANTVSRIASGDWIMLSRRAGTNPHEYHRWYRVAAIDGEAEIENDIWTQRVLLDGPDWDFGYNSDGTADNSLEDNTYATLVEGVVSVSEKVLKLTDI